ncbi:MAG: hypothetical protein IPN95_04720 [Bacteroidetes bacterium]|nr:hypothetical protein [Bacteroidota bacterium]
MLMNISNVALASSKSPVSSIEDPSDDALCWKLSLGGLGNLESDLAPIFWICGFCMSRLVNFVNVKFIVTNEINETKFLDKKQPEKGKIPFLAAIKLPQNRLTSYS